MTSSVKAYRNSVTDGATHIDILVACYDALAEDVRMAGNAAAKGDLATRCRHSQHGLLLIGHLESWLSSIDDADLVVSLTRFYEYLRAEIIRLQTSKDFEKFMALALLICETRAIWQKKQNVVFSRTEAGARAHSIDELEGAKPRFFVSA